MGIDKNWVRMRCVQLRESVQITVHEKYSHVFGKKWRKEERRKKRFLCLKERRESFSVSLVGCLKAVEFIPFKNCIYLSFPSQCSWREIEVIHFYNSVLDSQASAVKVKFLISGFNWEVYYLGWYCLLSEVR